MNHDTYLRTSVWLHKRAEVVARDGNVCTHPGCGETEGLEVHHLVYPRNPGEELMAMLTTLCRKHHKQAHRARPDLRSAWSNVLFTSSRLLIRDEDPKNVFTRRTDMGRVEKAYRIRLRGDMRDWYKVKGYLAIVSNRDVITRDVINRDVDEIVAVHYRNFCQLCEDAAAEQKDGDFHLLVDAHDPRQKYITGRLLQLASERWLKDIDHESAAKWVCDLERTRMYVRWVANARYWSDLYFDHFIPFPEMSRRDLRFYSSRLYG